MTIPIGLTDTKTVVAVATTSTTAALLPGQPGQKLLVSCNTDTYVRLGESGVAAASASAYTMFLPAGSLFVLRPTDVQTYVRAIRDGSDGVLSFQVLDGA